MPKIKGIQTQDNLKLFSSLTQKLTIKYFTTFLEFSCKLNKSWKENYRHLGRIEEKERKIGRNVKYL